MPRIGLSVRAGSKRRWTTRGRRGGPRSPPTPDQRVTNRCSKHPPPAADMPRQQRHQKASDVFNATDGFLGPPVSFSKAFPRIAALRVRSKSSGYYDTPRVGANDDGTRITPKARQASTSTVATRCAGTVGFGSGSSFASWSNPLGQDRPSGGADVHRDAADRRPLGGRALSVCGGRPWRRRPGDGDP